MGVIRQLEKHVAAQVAAGEVIESPAAVVRELVDNALDAQAQNIEVRIEKGGCARMVVRDDGVGMDKDDVGLAFVHHATSKLREAQELVRVRSLGFRGEALPSVAAVSRVCLRSAQKQAEHGWEVCWQGGEGGGLSPCAPVQGTRVEVEELFYNLPARRKFLGAKGAQAREVDRGLRLQALAWPEVGFRFVRDGELIWQRRAEDFGQRAQLVLAESEGMWPCEQQREGVATMSGLMSAPGMCRKGKRLQVWVLGRRAIRSEMLSSALRRAYGGGCGPGESPVAVMRLRLADVLDVDWNVHPAKQEVRFAEARRVEAAVEEMAQAALAVGSGAGDEEGDGRGEGSGEQGAHRAPIVARGDEGEGSAVAKDRAAQGDGGDQAGRDGVGFSERRQGSRADEGEHQGSVGERQRGAETQQCGRVGEAAAGVWGGDASVVERVRALPRRGRQLDLDMEQQEERAEPQPAASDEGAPMAAGRRSLPDGRSATRWIGMLYGDFALLEQGRGLLIADLLRVLERLAVEQLGAGRWGADSQRLLLPLTVDLAPRVFEEVVEKKPLWENLGWELEEFGGNSLLVRAAPANWPTLEAAMLPALFENLAQTKERPPVRMARAWARSVMTEGKIDEAKAMAWLQQLWRCEQPYLSPSGQATVWWITDRELARRFGRR